MSYLHAWRPDLSVQPSPRLRWLVAGVHLLTLLLVLVWPVYWLWRLVLGLLVIGHFISAYRRYCSLSAATAVRRVIWSEAGWMLQTNTALLGPCRLGHNSRLGQHFILLHLRLPGAWFRKTYVVPILRDSLPAACRDQQFHHLQVFLRWQRQTVLNPGLVSVDD